MRRLLLPLLLGLTHGVSDGAAGFLLGHLPYTQSLQQMGLLVLLYNGLAFGAQPLAGWLADHFRRPRLVALLGLPLMGLALIFGRAQPLWAVALAGLASALFHVGGGALALCATRGRAAGPGLFAAPGVVGLALGGALALTQPWLIWPFLGLLILCGAGLALLDLPALPYAEPRDEPLFESHDWIMLALLAAIALRSAVWSTLQYLMQGNVQVVILLAVAAALGKVMGGWLADRFGWRRWTLGALLAAAVVLTVAGQNLIALAVGVALLQSATPAALAAMFRQMPRYPATASGLALGFAIALGGLPMMGGYVRMLGSPWALGAMVILAGAAFWVGMKARERRAHV